MNVKWTCEISSNHNQDIYRIIDFIGVAKEIGCDAVKFQLFDVTKMFHSDALRKYPELLERKFWELSLDCIPIIAKLCKDNHLEFSCTPFWLEAVDILLPYVDSFKIASYELLWHDMIRKCASTGKPIVVSTGMATYDELMDALEIIDEYNIDKTLLHCVSSYPTPVDQCNLNTIEYRHANYGRPYGYKIGWSDHTVNPLVIYRAVFQHKASMVEFHLDLQDGKGNEYSKGHCWLPHQIAPVIKLVKDIESVQQADGEYDILVSPIEMSERDWRSNPSDGLRPVMSKRKELI